MRGKKGETGSQPRRGKVECEPDFSRFFRDGEREREEGVLLLNRLAAVVLRPPVLQCSSLLFYRLDCACPSKGVSVSVRVCVCVRGCLCACLSSIRTKALRICVQHILWTDALCFSKQDTQIYLLNRGTAQTHTHMLTQQDRKTLSS